MKKKKKNYAVAIEKCNRVVVYIGMYKDRL